VGEAVDVRSGDENQNADTEYGGGIDWNVPIRNGEQLNQSLKRLGVPTLLVAYGVEYSDFPGRQLFRIATNDLS
jgi:hypothetical protein